MDEDELQYYIILPFSVLSFSSSAFIVVVCTCAKFIRANNHFKLVFILSIIELVYFLNRMIPTSFLPSSLCIMQGYINETTGVMNTLWLSYISFEMYSVVIKGNPSLKYGILKPLFIIMVFSSSISLIPLFQNLYGNSGAWCWIKSQGSRKIESLLLRIWLYYIIVWISIAFNSIVSLLVSKRLKKLLNGTQEQIVKRIKYYPMMLLMVHTPITVIRVAQEFTKNIFVPEIIAFSFNSFEGFCNFLIFVNHNEVKDYFKESFSRNYKIIPFQ